MLFAGKGRKPSGPEELAAALEVITELVKSEAGHPFAEAVTEYDAPDYGEWVRKPMDLGLIASKLRDKHYVSTGRIIALWHLALQDRT